MAAQIISLFQQTLAPSRDWTQQETAEFYRVESALIQAGVQLESDRGVSDEGDPWFIFCRADNGEVFIHFARIDGYYVVDGVAFESPARGRDFGDLIRSLLANYPLASARARGNSNIFVHPAALLIALVGAAFFHTSEAKAATTQAPDTKGEPRKTSLILASAPQAPTGSSSASQAPVDFDSGQAAAILLSAVLALHDDVIVATAPTLESVRSLSQVEALSLRPIEALGSYLPITPTEVPAATQISVDRFMLIAATSVAPSATQAASANSADITLAAPSPVEKSVAVATALDLSTVPPANYSSAKPLFFLKASTAPLPSVEAISVVSANATLAELIAKALPQVDRLPSSILDLINRGDHLDAATAGATLTPSEVAVASPAIVSASSSQTTLTPIAVSTGAQTTSQGVSAPTPTPAPVSTSSAASADTNSLAPTTASPTPALSAAEALKIHDAAITAAVTEFMSHVPHLDMLLQGNQLVIYDRDILDPLSGSMELDSVTIKFADGSSLSLVGTVTDLSYFHWPV